jgi:hypothetical protein
MKNTFHAFIRGVLKGIAWGLFASLMVWKTLSVDFGVAKQIANGSYHPNYSPLICVVIGAFIGGIGSAISCAADNVVLRRASSSKTSHEDD